MNLPSDRTLERTLERATRFLRAASNQPRIFSGLFRVGYRITHHNDGWRRVMTASGYIPDGTLQVVDVDSGVAEASAEIDALDAGIIQRLDAILRFDHADQHAFILHNIKPEEGGAAVVNVQLIVERLLKLREGRDDATRDADQATVAKLADRGLDEAYFNRLAALVEKAQSAAITTALPPAVDPEEQRRRSFEVYKWWLEWSAAARTSITNRSHLISLGLSDYSASNDA